MTDLTTTILTGYPANFRLLLLTTSAQSTLVPGANLHVALQQVAGDDEMLDITRKGSTLFDKTPLHLSSFVLTHGKTIVDRLFDR